MFPALVKLAYPIRLNAFIEDSTITKLHEKLLAEFDDAIGRYRKEDYSMLSENSKRGISSHLKEWIVYHLIRGKEIPNLKESSGRLGFKLEEVLDVIITNGSTISEEFDAEVLVSTELITIAGQFGDRFAFAYGDASEQLRNVRPITLYHFDFKRISGFEEYQPIQL